ncbi:hypothetical protein [Synechococcus sp. MIT S9508]|uniref:hypothetical protein n=1 Tax=Synechococcus sp. MIT S9508 TaxID=1801629 RepID=UPI0012E93E44|nr:hypothetical protein [Synechococcus sp. MIT S9508]
MPLITTGVTGLPTGKRSGQSSALGPGKSSHSPAIKTTSTLIDHHRRGYCSLLPLNPVPRNDSFSAQQGNASHDVSTD